jgi:predicted  nucleic acid-binding Zn-ribbon protein
VRCGTFYEDGSKDIISGCKCGGKLFFFVNERKRAVLEASYKLSRKDKEQIESDIYDLLGMEADPEKPIFLDLESIKIVKPGQYELDLVNLFKKQPLIYKLEEGKYMIDLPDTFKRHEKKK